MERLDDDGAPLARVTYLPGVTPGEDASSRSGSPRGSATAPWAVPGRAVGETDEAHGEAPAPGAAHHVSITALARRGMSRREVERHLRDRGFDDGEISDEVARLESDGYLDDVALAQTLVGTLQERKGLGRSAIAAELTRRLLAPAAIEYGLDLIDTGDELSRARELAVKRARQLTSLDREVAARRLSAFLARRGYGGSTIRAAVDHALPAATRHGVVFR